MNQFEILGKQTLNNDENACSWFVSLETMVISLPSELNLESHYCELTPYACTSITFYKYKMIFSKLCFRVIIILSSLLFLHLKCSKMKLSGIRHPDSQYISPAL